MKAFLTSVGEKTTQICREQLEKFGFSVVMLDEKESWEDKYKRFIFLADDDCIRIDADIIPNENIKKINEEIEWAENPLMIQFEGYDFYKNNKGIIGLTYYTKQVLEIIKNNLDKIDWRRPEATAWRLPEINKKVYTSNLIVGMHGFFQDRETMARAKQNKVDRKQIEDYDFELVEKLLNK